MKKTSLLQKGLLGIAAACFIAPQTHAQIDDHLFGSLELNPTFWTAKGSDPSFNVNFTTSYRINDYLGIGAGVGIIESFKFSGDPMLPIFGRITAQKFGEKFTPFATVDIGYNPLNGGGMVFNPVVGVRYEGWTAGIGYYGYKPTDYSMMSGIAVRLGYTFGYHKSDSKFARALRKLEFSMALSGMMGGTNAYNLKEENTISQGENNVYGYQKGRAKESHKGLGGFSLALTYPVWRNLYVGVGAQMGAWRTSESLHIDTEWTEAGLNNSYYGKPAFDKYTSYSRDDRDEHETSIDLAVFGRLKYKFREFTFAKKLFPYVQVDMGAIVSADQLDEDRPFYFSPEVGLSLAVGSRHSLDIGLGLTQLYSGSGTSAKFHTDNRDWLYLTRTYTRDKEGKFNSFRISVGYTF